VKFIFGPREREGFRSVSKIGRGWGEEREEWGAPEDGGHDGVVETTDAFYSWKPRRLI